MSIEWNYGLNSETKDKLQIVAVLFSFPFFPEQVRKFLEEH